MDKSPQQHSVTAENFRRVREVFESALELPILERKAFVAAACGHNAAMIRELELMLAAEEQTDILLDRRPGLCSSCKSEIAVGDRFCRACGTPAGLEAGDEGRFRPGALFARRFRIAGLLGRGGMGEVYRATDLELGQPVALKFLSGFRFDERARNRLRNEVKLARQISHPNVCRVYDIGEAQGELYLSMEYVDGQDLTSLLKRIGRLPSDKAVQIARKLCAGLAAAHAKGVLHRDLKPGNIMIDAVGEVRIMDFGLAAVAEQVRPADARSGTPAYMAPEQLSGRDVSIQSDLYALGLVLYEIFTGQSPFEGKSLEELIRQKEWRDLINPSSWVRDLDPAIERAILRCLDANAKERPVSALALAAALPGGDPLAEALAAGETPSPEMVAASGSTEALRPALAIALLVILAAEIIAVCLLVPKFHYLNQLRLENSPDVLAANAKQIARNLGYTERPRDVVSGFYYQDLEISLDDVRISAFSPYLNYIGEKLTGSIRTRIGQWKFLLSKPPWPISFWYRESPEPIVSWDRLSLEAPPAVVSGMVSVVVGLDGRLLQFEAVPPQVESSGMESTAPDWAPLFSAAHLDIHQFQSVDPQWTPLAATDLRVAWTGPYLNDADLMVRVEGAAFRGKVVFFKIVFPWTEATRMPQTGAPIFPWEENRLVIILQAALCVIAAWLARRNLKSGRGDLRGAFRLAFLYFVASLVVDLLRNNSFLKDRNAFVPAIAVDLYFSFLVWAFYIAVEPWVRRYWPQAIITWSRAAIGQWRDVLVARDVLAGMIWGLAMTLVWQCAQLVGIAGRAPASYEPSAGPTLAGAAAFIVSSFRNGLLDALAFFLILCLLRLLLRRSWLAALAFVALWEIPTMLTVAPGNSLDSFLVMLFMAGSLAVILTRFGLVSVAAYMATALIMRCCFFTTDFQSWYGQGSLLGLSVVSAVALVAFKVSLGGRPLWNEAVVRN